MRKIRLLLIAAIVGSALAGLVLGRLFPERRVDESLYLKEAAPDVEFQPKKVNHYLSASGYVAFNTYDIKPAIRGYAGPIKTLIVLSPEGRISGIRILEHKETPNYVHRMDTPEFLAQFLGKGVGDRFEPDEDIDAISRATVSVSALARSVRESSREVASEVMGMEVAGNGPGARLGLKWTAYAILFALALVLYRATRRRAEYQRLRDAILLASVLVAGIWLASPFSILNVFNLLLLRPSFDPLWIVVAGSTLFSIAVAGRLYCGWLCPFGALSELIGRLPIKKWTPSQKADDKWRNIKYYILALAVASVFISRKPEFGNFETYVTLFAFHGSLPAWALTIASLLLSLKVTRFWCRYLCPVAALTGILSRRAEGYPSRSDCPMGNKPDPLISECIRCNRCYRRPAENP